MNISSYWKAVLDQDPGLMRTFFHEKATINWHNTNEQFNLNEFIEINCEYPGSWDGEVERMEMVGDIIVTVTKVWAKEGEISFHVTSFMKILQDKIQSIDEYWSEDGTAPEWRLARRIGNKIK